MDQVLMQLALSRAGFSSLDAFLREKRLSDGVAEVALSPYLYGYELVRIQKGDSLNTIASRYGTSMQAILTANPGLEPENLTIGRILVVPLGFPVVPENVPMSYELMGLVVRGLEARYPVLREQVLGRTAYGRRIIQLRVGQGGRRVYYNAAHHANEWITSPLVLSCLERLLEAASRGKQIMGIEARQLLKDATLYLVPMVNPDGVDLVTGAASPEQQSAARKIADGYPEIPFPSGWKANLCGVDLNLNYPARWDEAREIKAELGFISPAPRDYVGPEPLSEQESRAMFDSTETIDPALTIAWHTQGKEIYWKFLDLEPEGARALGEQMAIASGYRLEEIPYASSFGGYKDWFIQDFDQPGYTIEAGEGENPLPISQLPEMIRDNLPIFLLGLTGGAASSALQTAGMISLPVRYKTEEKALENDGRPAGPKPLPPGDGVEMAWG